jgi:hypothetical protein
MVAEVPLEFPERGNREGAELRTVVRVEPFDGLDQADRRHLSEVFQGLAPATESAGQLPGQRQVSFDEAVAQLLAVRMACREHPERGEQLSVSFAVLPRTPPVIGVWRGIDVSAARVMTAGSTNPRFASPS